MEPVNLFAIDRYWFLTWTTYGSWLPGDARGYVGVAIDESGRAVNHNQYGTPAAPPNESLRESARRSLKSTPIVLTQAQAESLFTQLQETAKIRRWLLIAVAIMQTHLHLVVGVHGDPDPDKVLGDFKAYGSRCLNQGWGQPKSETWWTTGGSTRKLADDLAVETVVPYIRQQPNSLLIWTRETGQAK
ncbi:MAG: transposase [Planctomycetaceae bacterium]